MPVDQATIDQVRDIMSEQNVDDDLAPLTTFPEVLAYVATAARAEGASEAYAVELAVRASGMPPDDVRACERVLRALGFVAVADRLRQTAGRRKNGLAPNTKTGVQAS